MQIFRGNEADLKIRFGLSPMCVVWVGILRSKDILVTEPFLELCRAGGPLEPLLKDRSLLSALEKGEQFAELQRKHDPESQFPLVLHRQGKHNVLALQDEVIADAAWQMDVGGDAAHHTSDVGAAPPAMTALAPRLDLPLARPEFLLQGLESLFGEQEVARLKLAIATTVRPDEKIEAIRKMGLAQVPLADKGILFLHALGDSNPEVRKEAAFALRNIGAHEEVVLAIAALCGTDDQQRRHAIGSLGQMFPAVGEMEKGAILQVLLTVVREREFVNQRVHILSTLTRMVPSIPHNPPLYERLLTVAVELLVSMLDSLLECATELFLAVMAKETELAASFLWTEMRKTEIRRLRGLLLSLLAETKIDAQQRQELARDMAFNVGFGDELDPISTRLVNALVRLGETAVSALLDRFQVSIRITERMQVIKIVDRILADSRLNAELKDRTLHIYGTAFPSAPNPLRIAMLATNLVEDTEVKTQTKNEFATEALVDVHQDRLDQFYSAVEATLCRMRVFAIPALVRAIQNPLHAEQGKRAVHILGELVLQLAAGDSAEIAPLHAMCRQQLEGNAPYRGELFVLLGKLATSEAADANLANGITDYLLDNLCKTAHPYDVLDALGWCAAGRWTDMEYKIDICYLFTTLIDKKMPDRLFQEREGLDEKVYELSFKTTAYTDLLPIVISGLARLATPADVPAMIRKRVVEYLLKKWQELVDYRVIWGPKSITDLAQAMRDLCLSECTPHEDKIAIGKALYQKKDLFPVMDILAVISQTQATDEFVHIGEQLAQHLVDIAHQEDYSRAEDREQIAQAIGTVLQANRLSVLAEKSEALREKLLYTLFEALREDVFGVRDILRDLLACQALSERLRNEIRKRVPPKN